MKAIKHHVLKTFRVGATNGKDYESDGGKYTCTSRLFWATDMFTPDHNSLKDYIPQTSKFLTMKKIHST